MFEMPCLGVQKLIRSRYCLLLVLLPLAPGVFSESMPGKESVPSKEVQQRDARSNSEIRHAWKVAVDNYPLRATRLDLSVLSDKEQEEIQNKLSDPTRSYAAIGRDAYLTTANWAIVKREDGFVVWQAQIHSAAALSLNVRFSDFDLEPGMSVKVYGLSGGTDGPVGEYTGRGLRDSGKFWSLAALGDTVVVEYWLPAGREMLPVDFPFKVKRVNHRFRDEEGKLSGMNARRLYPLSCDDFFFCSNAPNYPEARGVANYMIVNSGSSCSGVLLNNKIEGDFTLYFLTAFHCIGSEVGSSRANGELIESEFWFFYDVVRCTRTQRLKATNARFVAGSTAEEGDWALLRIEGEVTPDISSAGSEGRLRYMGWSSESHEGKPGRGVEGVILHHPRGEPISFTRYDSEGLTDRRNDSFHRCTGSGCSHFEYSVDYPVRGGSSGAPIFYGPEGARKVAGVHTHSYRIECGYFGYDNTGLGSRFSRMWQDERLRGALRNGKNYNIYNGSISATPDPPVIAEGSQDTVSVDYGARSVSFSLNARADDASSLSWQSVSGSGPRRGSVRFTDNTGSRADIVYEVSGGIRQEDQFSIQVRGAGGTDVIVITVVPTINPPVIAEGAEEEFRVDYGARSVSFSLNARADDASSLSWQSVSGSGPRRGSVRFTDNTGSRADIVYEVSGGIRQEDQFSIQVRGAGGTDVIVITVVPTINPPVIAEGAEEEFRVDYGVRSRSFSLNARADDASSLSWQLVSGSGPRRGSVRFTDRTGSRADIVYEVSGGIRQEDQFSIQVRGAGGTDVIVITVVPTINPPVIAEGAEEEFRVDYGARSVSFSLNARADDASSLSWQSVSGSGPRRGSVRFTDNTGSRADIVYEVSGGIRQEDQFSIQVRGAGGTDVIVITVVPTINPPVIAEGSQDTVSVDYGARSVSFSLNARADDASSLSWQSVSGSDPRRGSVRFTDNTGSRADIVYEVSGGIRQEDQFSIQVRGAGGTDVIVITVVSIITNPPVIAEGVEEEFRVDYGVRSRSFSLNARADDASSLSWRLVSGSDPRRGSVRFTDDTGSRASIVYEVSGGIRQEDQFSVQVMGGGGTDVITVRVNVEPAIVEGDEKELSVAYGSNSVTLILSAGAANPDSLRWQLLSGSGSSVPGSRVYFLKGRGAEARVVYEVSGGIRQEDQFSVQVSGRGGSDVITVNVVAAPAIVEGGEEALIVAYGSSSGMLDLSAGAVNPDSLSWSGVTGQGSSVSGSRVYFLEDRGAEARVVYEVPGGIKEKDRFSVRVSDTYGSDEITIHVMPDRAPVISRVFGREVAGDDELTIYISPQTREVTSRAIAFDESPDTLEWTIGGIPVSGVTTARFLLNDAGENATQVSGTGSVRVLYRRGSTAIKSSSAVITVTDRLGQSDSFVLRFVEDETAPEIVNEGVMTTTRGKTLEVTIPYDSEQLILDLFTSSARAGLKGKQVSSTPTEAQASSLPADGEGVLKVLLSIQSGVDEAEFRIRVSNGSASEEIKIRVEREQVIPVRLKVLLGGATR